MAESKVAIEHEKQQEQGRFVLCIDSVKGGEMTWVRKDDTRIVIDHTAVDKAYGGQGYARRLVDAGVEYAREHQKKIIAECSYAKRVLEGDEKYADVRA